MSTTPTRPGIAVPSTRLSRLWHLGRATGDLAAGIGVKGLIELARTRRSAEPSRIRLSPEHTRRFTDRLARMRGAVMKMGQLMSMDGSDIFTPEAAEIMSCLARPRRADADEPARRGPGERIRTGLERAVQAVRVHARGLCLDRAGASGRDARRSSARAQDSVSGRAREHRQRHRQPCLPGPNAGHGADGRGPDALLRGARRQLHREADYGAEADALEAYRAWVGDDPDFFIPRVHRDLSTTQHAGDGFRRGRPGRSPGRRPLPLRGARPRGDLP